MTSQVGPGPGPGSQPTVTTVFSESLTLTDAQIKALPTTTQQIVAAPGANLIVVPFYAWFMVNWVADYGNIAATARIGVGYAGTGSSCLLQFLEAVNGQVTDLLADSATHAGFLGPFSVVKDLGGGIINVAGDGQFQDEPGVVNTALEVFAANPALGNFNGGNVGNSIKVTVLYTIIDVS